LLGSLFFPLTGLAIGAAGGALVGKSLGQGVDQTFVKEVGAALQPNTSALFVMVDGGNVEASLAVLRPFKGTVYQTSLPTDVEASLRRALEERTT
jgi:uncharacterized membrane protein